jgi:competence protein ComGF
MNKVRAFTLLECVVALLVTVMVAIVINFTLHSFQQQQPTKDATINWYLFLRELESPSHEFELVDCGKNTIKLHSKTRHKQFDLKHGNQKVYLTLIGNGGGYLPLLDHVKKFQPRQISDQQVELSIELDDGRQYHGVVKFLKGEPENETG